ncbi:hypothetical protein PUN28_004540 [Cardiocondyla obscurior]|uniref:Uncharacterized protein n=1 Tax=Cardiocondyla obscurior TaxID=286306 RepID=A0AAW2GE29_9HYME
MPSVIRVYFRRDTNEKIFHRTGAQFYLFFLFFFLFNRGLKLPEFKQIRMLLSGLSFNLGAAKLRLVWIRSVERLTRGTLRISWVEAISKRNMERLEGGK